jgi:glutamate-1-semialdehyde 2,1-aminomutase
MAAGAASASLYERALRVLPGGVNSPVRAMRSIGRDPVFIERGKGPYIWDVDGNRYVDWVSSWGPLILGHVHPRVIEAVAEAAARGTSYGAPTEGEVALAEEVCSRFSSVEMLRMTSSGTEASMSAIRLARAATGRDPILKFAGAYHGHVDGLLADAGSGLATAGVPASPGVTEAQAVETVIVPWNDAAAVEVALAEREFAAIIAEPIPANMGLVPAAADFLGALRSAADKHGALLILDEVISGFRVARGGAQELLGVKADLTVMGKVIGGGLPAAAYGGSRDLMERVAPAGDVYQAGTLSGNPLAVAAGMATLAELDAGAYQRLAETTTRLGHGLQEAAGERPVTVVFGGPVEPWPPATVYPGLLTPFFRDTAPRDFAGSSACDTEAYGRFCRALLARGVWPPASQFEAWFPSLAHDDDSIEQTLAAAGEAFEEAFE